MIGPSSSRTRAFISYSHKDGRFLDELHDHLAFFERQGLIDVWDDRKLKPGDPWEDEIKRAIKSARVGILLISPAFLASEFVAHKELPPLLAAAKSEGALLLSIIVQPCLFQHTLLSQFQTVNDPAKPLSELSQSKRHRVWMRVAELINEALNTHEQADQSPQQAQLSAEPLAREAPLSQKASAYEHAFHVATTNAITPKGRADGSTTRQQPEMPETEAADLKPSLGTLRFTYRGHSEPVLALAWAPNGRYIASGSKDQTVQVWRAATGGKIFTHRAHTSGVVAAAWSPDSKRIASAEVDGTVQIWDAATGSEVFTGKLSSRIYFVAWSPDGERIALASDDQAVQIWDAIGNPLFAYRGHTDHVRAVAWSPDGQRIASASRDNTVQIWDVAGKTLFTYRGHSSSVYTVAWSSDGERMASASADQTVQVWNLSTSKPLISYSGHTDAVLAIAWSPDSKHIVSASDDYTAQIWEAITGNLVFTYRGHADYIRTIGWSPDGTHIASGSYDNTVQVWQAV